MKRLMFSLLFVAVIASCDKEDDLGRFYWNQTKCADPWNTGENDANEQTEAAVTDFLGNEGITVLNVGFDNKSPLSHLCESCACGTGQRIIIDTEEKYGSLMKEIGFYQ